MNGFEQLLPVDLAYRLGWTLIHSLWQGVAVAGVFGLSLLVVPRAKTNARYVAGCLSLLATVLSCAVTFVMIEPPEASVQSRPAVIEVVERGQPAKATDPVVVAPSEAPGEIVLLEASPPVAAGPMRPAVANPLDTAPAKPWRVRVAELNQARLAPLLPWLAGLWLLGVSALSMWRFGGVIATCRLRKIATAPVSEEIRALVTRLAERLRVSRPARVLQSAVLATPAVIGHLRPAILLPLSALTGLSTEEIEAIIAHELAHIRRHDYLVNILQTAIETLLFHHPAVWWISRRVRAERENCCDDLALAVCADRLTYARALTQVQQLGAAGAGLAAAASGGSLVGRIRRIVESAGRGTDQSSRWLAGAVTITVVVASAICLHMAACASGDRPTSPTVAASEPAASARGPGLDSDAEFIAAHLTDPKLPEMLLYHGRLRTTRQDERTARVKAALRQRLREKPDPALALSLASIIVSQSATEPRWETPEESGATYWLKEDPTENYETLAEVLTAGFDHAAKGSDLWRTLGMALAKLRLLQGDWAHANKQLVELGVKPIPLEQRSLLTAPPCDLSKGWSICEESMRSGNCRLILQFQKDGKGLRGAHVALRRWAGRITVSATGERCNQMLSFRPDPFWFGCPVEWEKTRYGISDETGQVAFDKLPEAQLQMEVLVPTGNFTEPGRGWQLWVEIPPGKLQPARHPRSAYEEWDPEDPTLVVLKAGETVRYPRFVVYPEMDLGIIDWQEVDPETFVLSWPPATYGQGVTYELEMGAYDVETDSWLKRMGHTTIEGMVLEPDHAYMTGITKEVLKATQWDVGARGVGGQRLKTGGIYAFAVTARDKNGNIVSQPSIRRVRVRSLSPESAPTLAATRPAGLSEPIVRPASAEEKQRGLRWVVYGRVTDERGRPVPGVRLLAYSGPATLFKTGETSTVEDGSYTLRFTQGAWSPDPLVLPAVIYAGKDGFYERDMCWQGNRHMSRAKPDKRNYAKIDPEKVLLPDKPERIDFVMLPAAVVRGRLFDGSGKPMPDRKVTVTGARLYPASSVLATATTDADGRFALPSLPPGEQWFELNEAVTGPVRFAEAGPYDLRLVLQQPEGRKPLLSHVVTGTPTSASGAEPDKSGVDVPIASFEDPDPRVREQAARELGQSTDRRAVEALIGMLKDEDVGVRREAARALGRLGDVRAVGPLIELYHDRKYESFKDALRALGEIGGEKATAVLIEALQDQDEYARNFAARALERSGWKPADREQRIRYLLALEKWDEAVAAGPAAKSISPGAGQAEGPFELDIPIVVALKMGDEGRTKSLGYPVLQYKVVDKRLQAVLDVRFSSHPRTRWLMSVDLLDAAGKVLDQATAAHVTSGIIETFALVEPAEIHFQFGRELDPAKAARFRFSIQSLSTDQGNPLVYDKELPLSLRLNTIETSNAVEARWVRFERRNDRLTANVRLHWLSWPKAEYLTRVEIRDSQDRAVAQAERSVESSGIIAGLPFSSEDTLRLELGRMEPLEEAPQPLRYLVWLERVDVQAGAESRPSPAGLHGTVLLPSGKPAAGAQVVLLLAEHEARFVNGRFEREVHNRTERRPDGVSAVTDADGRFAFPERSAFFALAILHDEGYIELPFARLTGSPITLRPWARVEGVVLGLDKFKTSRPVDYLVTYRTYGRSGLGDRGWQHENANINLRYSINPDSQGRFIIERVPPGECWLKREWVRRQADSEVHLRGGETRFEIGPGQTTRVTVGGMRRVVGRLLAAADADFQINPKNTRIRYFLEAPGFHVDSSGIDPVFSAYQEFLRSDEGKAYSGDVSPAEDGSFEIRDLPPARYFMQVRVLDLAGQEGNKDKVLGWVTSGFNLTAGTGDANEPALDVGTIEVQPGEGSPKRDWGEAVEGVQCRLWIERTRLRVGESPRLGAGIRNRGGRELFVARSQELCELQVDGRWYRWAGAIRVKSSHFPPGGEFGGISITPGPQWQAKDDGGAKLDLRPGRHTIRLAFIAEPSAPDGGRPIRVVSNPVEVEIAEAAGEAPRTTPPAEGSRIVLEGPWAKGQVIDGAGKKFGIEGPVYVFDSGDPKLETSKPASARCSMLDISEIEFMSRDNYPRVDVAFQFRDGKTAGGALFEMTLLDKNKEVLGTQRVLELRNREMPEEVFASAVLGGDDPPNRSGKAELYFRDVSLTDVDSYRLIVSEPDVAGLMQLLDEEDTYPRESAARALGQLGSAAKPAVPKLTQMLDDPEPYPRDAARQALQRVRDGRPSRTAPAETPATRPTTSARLRGLSWQILRAGDAVADAKRVLPEIAGLGADTVLISNAGYQENAGSETISVDPNVTPSREQWLEIFKIARDNSLRVILMPIILLAKPHENEWRGVIFPSDWDKWFANYREFLLHFARIAAEGKVEVFMVGSELVYTERFTDRWKQTIREVRSVYPGKLSYSANWDHWKVPQFWDDLDLIGMTTYYKLSSKPNPSLDSLTEAWKPIKAGILAWQNTIGKPILFTDVGWCSQEGASIEPWNYYYNTKPSAEGLEEQRRCYAAFIKTWDGVPQVGGIIWNWNRWSAGVGGKDDVTYTPKGKPAERELRSWFRAAAQPGDGGASPPPRLRVVHRPRLPVTMPAVASRGTKVLSPASQSATQPAGEEQAVRIFELKDVRNTDVGQTLRNVLKAELGKHWAIVDDMHANVLLLAATNKQLDRIAYLIAQLDKPPSANAKEPAESMERVAKVVRPKHAKASDVADTIASLYPPSPSANLRDVVAAKADNEREAVLVACDPSMEKEIDALVAQVDTVEPADGFFKVFHLPGADIEDMLDALQDWAKGKKTPVQFTIDHGLSSLIVEGKRADIQAIAKFLGELDRAVAGSKETPKPPSSSQPATQAARRAVFLDAAFVRITGQPRSLRPENVLSLLPPDSTLEQGIKALKGLGEVEVIAHPAFSVGEPESLIRVGDKVPYLRAVTTGPDGKPKPETAYWFIGLAASIQAQWLDDVEPDRARVRLNFEQTAVGHQSIGDESGVAIPLFNKREYQREVTLQDGLSAWVACSNSPMRVDESKGPPKRKGMSTLTLVRLTAMHEPPPAVPAAGRSASRPSAPKLPDDIADVPVQDLTVGGNDKMRYFLIGPRSHERVSAEGYKLLVVLPGGDGGADFNPFVCRIFKNALPAGYIVAQPVAFKWTADQQIVWPTRIDKVMGQQFATEDFVEAVIKDVRSKHKVDDRCVFTLSWSSGGPAAYAISLAEKSAVTGSFVAMSVFKPDRLPSLDRAEGHAYYLYHSPDDRVCPYRMAQKAESMLKEKAAAVAIKTYPGGHGWKGGDIFGSIRTGIEWLERQHGDQAPSAGGGRKTLFSQPSP